MRSRPITIIVLDLLGAFLCIGLTAVLAAYLLATSRVPAPAPTAELPAFGLEASMPTLPATPTQANLPTRQSAPTAALKTGACPAGCASATPPAGCTIKGDISASGAKIYFLAGAASYGATIVEPSKGERWFCTENEARASGWKRSP